MIEKPQKNHTCDIDGCTEVDTVPCALTLDRETAPWKFYFDSYGLLRGLRHIWELVTKGETETIDYYCRQHAKVNGFCSNCGQFWGSELDDAGLCESCREGS